MIRKSKAKETTIDKLAMMVAKGFEHVDKRFDNVDKRFEQVDQRFEQVDKNFSRIEATLSTMQRDIEEIQREMVYKDEMENLMARVKYVEMKLGIESGK